MGLILLYKRSLKNYYILFIIATLNRETTCFLTFIFLFTTIGKKSYKTIGFHCLLQFAIWIAIKLWLYQLYSGNPGLPVENHFTLNIGILANPRNYPLLLSSLGFIWIPVVFYHRAISDVFVRRSILVTFPFMFGMLWVGNLPELRIYGELIPVFLSAFLLILRELRQ
jgi:hypothetical protein